MKLVKAKDLKVGQVVLFGDMNSNSFQTAKFEKVSAYFNNWEKVDMDNGRLLERDGLRDFEENEGESDGVFKVLNSREIEKINKMKDKIKMLEALRR